MLAWDDDCIVALRPSARSIQIVRVTQADRYHALRCYAVRPIIAEAIVAGLITVNVTRDKETT